MARIAIIGNQFGDEGKGKVISTFLRLMSESSPDELVLVYRWQGGANAGHTITTNHSQFKLHQLPSGLVSQNTYSLLGPKMYISPRNLIDEIRLLNEQGISVSPSRLGIASNAHITLDHHIKEDNHDFNGKSSTGKGIKPTGLEKYNRTGLRFAEFLDTNTFKEVLHHQLQQRNPVAPLDQLIESYELERSVLAPFIVDPVHVLRQPWAHMLFEGAQGVGLDTAWGLYAGVTSSSPAEVPRQADIVLAVAKAYTSSVGVANRPFVSQLSSVHENKLRDDWGEYGTTTRNPRSLGYFDAVLAKRSVQVSGAQGLVVTCLDRIENVHRHGFPWYITVGYQIGDQVVRVDDSSFPDWLPELSNRAVMRNASPINVEYKPWSSTTEKLHNDAHPSLTSSAQGFISAIEEYCGVPVVMAGIGPKDEDYISLQKFGSITGL